MPRCKFVLLQKMPSNGKAWAGVATGSGISRSYNVVNPLGTAGIMRIICRSSPDANIDRKAGLQVNPYIVLICIEAVKNGSNQL